MELLHEFLEKSGVKNSFDPIIESEVWSSEFGTNDYFSKIKKILIHKPGNELRRLKNANYNEELGAYILSDEEGRPLSYYKGEKLPDFDKIEKEHANLANILKKNEVEVFDFSTGGLMWTNRLFARDIALMTPNGAILCRMAGYFRQGEIPIIQKTLSDLNIPILGAIQGKGFVEGGSFTIVNKNTAVIGKSVRVNQEGIDQLSRMLKLQEIDLVVVDIPISKIHLDEIFVMIDKDLALGDLEVLPHWFIAKMKNLGIKVIGVSKKDPDLTNNCLALSPNKVLFPASGKKTIQILEKNGVNVIPIDVSEINKMGGGIHCLTLPLYREK